MPRAHTKGNQKRGWAVSFVVCVACMGRLESAALAVAIIRALDRWARLELGDARICDLAFECEKISHGTPILMEKAMTIHDNSIAA